MQVIKHFGRRLTISRQSERSDFETALRFSDTSSALAFLQRTLHNHMTIKVFRNVLKAEQDGTVLHLADDHLVLEKLSRMLCSGRLMLHNPHSVGTGIANGLRSTGKSTERSAGSGAGQTPKHAPRREPRPMPPPKPRPATIPKPVPAIDTQQQVATLLTAGTDGTPFWEQCEMARNEGEVSQ
jgi:hypothetical protein